MVISILFLIFMNKELSKKLSKFILKIRFLNTIINNYNIKNSFDLFYEDFPKLSGLKIPFILSIIGWILQFYLLFLISKLFQFEINLIYFIAIISITNVITSLPITIYGLGTREITLLSLFSIFNISPEKSVSLSLFWFLIFWLSPSIIGGLITINEGFFKQKNYKKTY